MDSWNRNNQNNEYTGITAQRRNRRRTGAGQAQPETEKAAPDLSAWRRPVVPAKPEHEPLSAADSGKTESDADIREEQAPLDETAAAEDTGAVKAEISGEPKTVAEPEASPEPDRTEKPEEASASDTPEEPFVVQGTDSRVPPEARRMAAAPYGAAGAARRTGTRPQAAQSRVSLPEGKREPARSWRDKTADRMSPVAGKPQGNPQKARVRVGYAPGRMSDGMTQQVPVVEAAREQLYGRDAKAYLEKRRHPFQTEEAGGKDPNYKEHEMLRIVLILLLIIGAVMTAILIQRNRSGMDPKMFRDPPRVISAVLYDASGMIAPVELSFTAETEKDVDGLRLRGEGDMDLDTVASFADNADGKHWTVKMTVATGFSGTVTLQARRSGEEEWYDTQYTFPVEVASPIGVEPSVTPAAAEEDADSDVEDDEGEDEIVLEEQPGQQETVPGDEAGEDLPIGELKTPKPTATPAPVTPVPTATPPLTVEPASEGSADLITNTTVWTGTTKKVKEYSRPAKELIHMPAADEYTKRPLGVMTFRGDNFRRNAATGTMSAAPKELSVLWQTEAGSARGTNQTYYGYGWTGQPVIARWSTEVRSHSNITDAKQEKRALKEVIIAGLDGVIRFLDLENGEITRNSIKLGYPMRGTPSLHTRGYPFMSVGQFARKMKGRTGMIGMRQYNLFTGDDLKMIDGNDGKYHRPLNNVGSFETSALIDRESDTLIAIGSNGALYLESLGSTFDYNTGIMTISPSTTVMTSKVKGQKNTALLAVESSPAAYDRYVFYADMGGVLRCVDTNTLTTLWAANTGDSVMAAVAMDLTESRELDLYTANMLNNRKKGDSNIQIRKYDALSGKELWTTEVGVTKSKKDKAKDNVGAKASPVIGQHALNSLVYFTVTGLSEDGRSRLGLKNDEQAALIALDKETGKAVWSFGLSSRSESSPIALYDNDGNGWIVQCEQKGIIHLLDGLTGSEVTKLTVSGEIEASPAAYNNVVVVGTTGKNTSFVYGIEVKLEKVPAGAAEQPEESGEGQEQPEENEEAPEDAGEEPEMLEESEDVDEEDSGGA